MSTLMAARASGKMATKGNLVHGKITKKNPSLPERRVYRQNKKLRKAVKNRSVTRAQAEMPEMNAPVGTGTSPFGSLQSMDGIEEVLASLSHSARLGGAVLLVAGAISVGYTAGGAIKGEAKPITRAIGATVMAGAAAIAVTKLKEKTYKAAGIELQNLCATYENPSDLSQYVQLLAPKYGLSSLSGDLQLEMKRLYDVFLSAQIPSSDAPLRGDEASNIKAFKDALGIEDAIAAECHIELGNKFSRQRLESGSKEGGLQELRGFQKLVFVSEQVFGEQKSKFLLPWKRVFNLTDAQLSLAKRDNAKTLYVANFQNFSRESLNENFLSKMRILQLQLGLSDDVASDCMSKECRKQLELLLDEAVETMNQRVRVKNLAKVVELVDEITSLSHAILNLAEKPDLACGLVQLSVYGGKYASDSQRSQLRDLYKVYLEERLTADGEVSSTTVQNLESLKLIFAMGNAEASKVKNEVTSKTYRKFLAAAYRDGTLEGQESKAQWLQQLCEKIDFDGEEAMSINVEQYRMKLESILDKKGSISDEDEDELTKIQKLLCIQIPQIQEINSSIKGRAFNKTLQDILTVTADAFGNSEIMRLRKAVNDLRLDKTLAMELASNRARQEMKAMVQRVRSTRNQVDAAQELKKIVFYSTFVLTPIVEEIDPEIAEENKKRQEEAEIMSLMAKAQEEANKEEKAQAAGVGEEAIGVESSSSDGSDMPSTLQKAKKGFEAEASPSTRGQKVITLKDDFEIRDRQDLYRMYLLYCMQGEVRKLGLGSSVVLERDETEFARLIQLGDVLGLTDSDTFQIHQSLSEQAFKNQAQQMVAGSSMTPEKEAQLKEIQKKLGLNDEIANKVIKGLVDKQMVGNLQALHAQGLLTISKLRELKNSGADIDGVMKKEARESLYKKEIEMMLTNGEGVFDREEVLVNIPKDLGIEEKTAKGFVDASVKGRLRLLFVQAISFLRQRKVNEMLATVNNVLACHQAVPSETISWKEKEELLDVYAYFYNNIKDTKRLQTLSAILGLTKEDVSSIQNLVDSGKFIFEEQSEDDMVIF